MKLLVFSHEYPPIGGGASNGIYFLGQAWRAQGHEVTVITSGFKAEPLDAVVDGIRVIRIPCARRDAASGRVIEMFLYMGQSMLQASRWFKMICPDLVVAFMTIPSAPAACWMHKKYGVPYIVELRGGDVPGFYPERLRLTHFIFKPLILFLWKNAKRVIANSQGLKQLALKADPNAIIDVYPNGVDPDIFKPTIKTSKPTVRLLFVGRLEDSHKNVGELIGLLPDLLGVGLTIIGDGGDRVSLEKKCLQLGVQDRVSFVGWASKPDLAAAYASADIFVSLSRWEGMPNAALEAMSSGLPLVLSDISGHNELVDPQVNGVLVPLGRRQEILAALSQLTASPALRDAWGRSGRSRAVELHDWNKLAQLHLK